LILSASRRTDLVAWHLDWLLAGFRRGWVEVENPFRPSMRSRVSLAPGQVEACVFWTRDPRPILPVIDPSGLVQGLPALFLVTLTGYGPPLEPRVPGPHEAVAAIRDLAGRVGSGRVVWRYDPVVLGSGPFSPEAHRARFRSLANALRGSTRRVVLSLVDWYRKTGRRLRPFLAPGDDPGAPVIHEVVPLEPMAMGLVSDLREEARRCGMSAVGCCEPEWDRCGLLPASPCIDPVLLREELGLLLPGGGRDRGQRPGCRCAPARDIGRTDTCGGGCLYCYATGRPDLAVRRATAAQPCRTPLLCGDDEGLAPPDGVA